MVVKGAHILVYALAVILVQAHRQCEQSHRYGYNGEGDGTYVEIICHDVDLSNTVLTDDSYNRYDRSYSRHILKIFDSDIPIIPTSAFMEFTSIIGLYLNGSHIKEILPSAFNSLNSLERLYLFDNNLTKVSDGVFNSLVNLIFLDLSKNSIEVVSEHSFIGLLKLEMINLSQNVLKFLSNNVFTHLGYIKTLDLSDNQLSMFNFTIMPKQIINNLNLSNNRIHELEGCFTHITFLDLSRNELSSLEYTNCLNNDANITYLNLAYNSLTNLSTDLSNMYNLKYLYLQNNNITLIPNGFFAHLNLLSLNLSCNKLEQFQYGLFDRLYNLEILDISHNKLNDLRTYTYHSLKHLKELYLQYNEISSLNSRDLARSMPQLKNISLEGNNFTCDTLVEIFHNLRLHNVIPGHSFNRSNIHGIACSEVEDDLDLSPSENFSNAGDIAVSKLSQFFNSGFIKSGMYRYFNGDFKTSEFVKYLEKLKDDSGFKKSFMYQYFNEDFKNSSFYKYLENIKADEQSNLQYNQRVKNYFEHDFKNTSFVKYLDNLNKALESTKGDFSKSGMYNYFNSEFKNSSFYKYLEALKTPLIIKSFGNDTDAKAEKFISTIAQEKKDTVTSPVVINIILLIAIVCLMGFSTYMNYIKLYRRNELKNEHVELIEA